MHVRNWSRVAVLVASLALALGLAAPSAHAADAPGIDPFALPAQTTTVWIEFEQAGLAPAALTVRATHEGAAAHTVAMSATTFGLHGEFAAGPGLLVLEVLPTRGSRAASPDLVVVALDASGGVLTSTNLRLSVPAGPAADSDDPPQPAKPAGDGSLAKSGGIDPWWIACIGLVLAALGAVVGVARAAAGKRTEAKR